MNHNSLERSLGSTQRYDYLSLEDSILYDQVKDSKDNKDIIIIKLILDKARLCRVSHCASNK